MNPQTGHTPGPWVYRFRGNGATVETEECETPIALVNPTMGRGNVDADAQLITVAPELLELCKCVFALRRRLESHPGSGIDWTSWLDQANAAIAKAEGRT